MGVPIATYTQHEAATRHLPARRADKYAEFFKIAPEYLLFGRGEAPERVPVYDSHGEATGKTAAMPPRAGSLTRAVQGSEGDGIVHFGFVALYNQPTTNHWSPNLNNRLCVVSICDGEGHLRQLIRIAQPGTADGQFHLIGGAMPLIDHKVLWIAPVIALVPL